MITRRRFGLIRTLLVAGPRHVEYRHILNGLFVYDVVVAWSLAIWLTLLRGAEIKEFAGHRKITGQEEGFIPAPLLDASMSES